MSSLLCLFLMLQLCSLCCLYISQSAKLVQASKQSTIDLSICSQAKAFAAENSYIRRCLMNQQDEDWEEDEEWNEDADLSDDREEDYTVNASAPVIHIEPETEREIEVDGIPVTLVDDETCITATYRKNGRTIRFQLFYNENGIVSTSFG